MYGLWGRKPNRLKSEFFFRKFKRNKDVITAVCDKELLGKSYEEGKKRLKVSEHFYKGKEGSIDEVKKAMKTSTILNLVGEKSVAIGVELGLINEENIIKIEGIKHAQMCEFEI